MKTHFYPSNDLLMQYVRDYKAGRATMIVAAMDQAMTSEDLADLKACLWRGDAAVLEIVSASASDLSNPEVIHCITITPDDIGLFDVLKIKRKMREVHSGDVL